MAMRKKYSKYLLDVEVDKIIKEIRNIHQVVYKVDVHAVGIEYRMLPHRLEEIVGGNYFWDGKRITKEQHDRIREILNDKWLKTGQQWQRRGLY